MSDDQDLSDAIQLFIHGAKTLHVGHYLDSRAMERKGLKIIDTAAEMIDTKSQTGREPLLPLLEHPDEGVRTVAAGALWQSHTDVARKVLERVKDTSIGEAGGVAMKILMFHGRSNPVRSDPLYEGLHDDENGINCWSDPAFRERAFWGQLPSTFARRGDGNAR